MTDGISNAHIDSHNRHLHITAPTLHIAKEKNDVFAAVFALPPIVGYETISGISANQFVALGTVFENVDGTDVAIKDLVTVGTPVGSGAYGGADQIWVWNTTSAAWTKYFYYSARGVKQWRVVGGSAETTDTISTGTTFFFCRSSSATGTTTLTLSGKVKALDGSSSFTVAANQLAFASNPWPVALTVKDFNNYYTDGEPVGGGNIGGADQIWLWDTDAAGWTKYFYYSGRGVKQWRVNGGAAAETTDTIPAGVGFFFQRAASATAPATITFTK